MKKFLIILTFAGLFILSAGCNSSQKPATGFEDEIYVVADSLEYEELKEPLQASFEIVINTPSAEKLFTLKRVSPDQIKEIKNKKNIIIAAPLNSGSNTSQYINSVADNAERRKLDYDHNFLLNKYNLWAKNQLVMILSAKNIQELQAKILNNKDSLLNAFQKISDKRLKESLYTSKYERKAIEGLLLRDYGWIIYIQTDYKLEMNDAQNNFVLLKRSQGSDIESWIFIHWIDNATTEYLNPDSIKSIRNRLTKKIYLSDNVESYFLMADGFYRTTEVNFNGRFALSTQGLWDVNTKNIRGPFVNYTFYDEKNARVYMLDGFISTTKYYKRNLIQQIDVILQSFLTKDELSKDRSDDLIYSIDDSINN